MIAFRSISLRLTVWFSSVFFAGLALFGGVMWLDLHDTLTSGRSRTLARRAERLGDLLAPCCHDLLLPCHLARVLLGAGGWG